MQQDSASFWSEIKTLDTRLTENPDSLCFAQLASVYLKVGLVDDALHCARQGVQKHPRYLAGLRVLATACYAKGLQDECRTALEQLTSAMPEDAEAEKMLAQIYLQSGNSDAARACLQIVLDFNPDDTEARMELATLSSAPAAADDADEVIEELDDDDIVEVDDSDLILEEETAAVEENTWTEPAAQSVPATGHHDPLSTATLAELYVKQGFIDKALVIYRALLTDNPGNPDVLARIKELEPPSEPIDFEQEPEPGVCHETVEAVLEPDIATEPSAPQQLFAAPVIEPMESAAVPPSGSADNRIATLTTWLENIRRIKSCR